jgi:hypothetical protein
MEKRIPKGEGGENEKKMRMTIETYLLNHPIILKTLGAAIALSFFFQAAIIKSVGVIW